MAAISRTESGAPLPQRVQRQMRAGTARSRQLKSEAQHAPRLQRIDHHVHMAACRRVSHVQPALVMDPSPLNALADRKSDRRHYPR